MTTVTAGSAFLLILVFFQSLGLIACGGVEIPPVTQDLLVLDEPQRQCLDRNPLRNPYFGDTHVHTVYSLDAYTQDIRVTPADAYRFAKGNKIGVPPYDARGKALRSAQLDRPLDFAMVSDHAEFFGDRALCLNEKSKAFKSLTCQLFRAQNFTTNVS